MYIQRESFYPGLGKGPELRALLEERVKGQQANGRAIGLSVGLFGGPEGNPYIFNFRYQDLAAFESEVGNGHCVFIHLCREADNEIQLHLLYAMPAHFMKALKDLPFIKAFVDDLAHPF